MPSHYRGTPEELRALDAFIKLTRATESVLNRLAKRGTQGELTPSQFGVLEALYHLGEMCPSELGIKILRSSSDLTTVIDNLEKRKLVRRLRDATDRRKVQISLTEEGRQLITQLLPAHVAAITEEMSVLSPQEQETLGELCRKLGLRQVTHASEPSEGY